MVSAEVGDNFGDMTLRYLKKIRRGNGFMIAGCTKHYGEVTASPFSSFEEMRYAVNNRINIIPLRLADEYPPQPDFGPHHLYDKDGMSDDYISVAFPGSLAFVDCRPLTPVRIADILEHRLLQNWEDPEQSQTDPEQSHAYDDFASDVDTDDGGSKPSCPVTHGMSMVFLEEVTPPEVSEIVLQEITPPVAIISFPMAI